MKKNLLLLCFLGGCASASQVNTPPPAGCPRTVAELLSPAAATEPAEQMPRTRNRRVIERRLADSVASLPIDSVPRPVVLRWRVSAEGRPEQVAVARSSGSPELDAAAVWAMGFGEFDPARLNGCPVAVFVEAPLEARIRRPRRAPAPASGVQAPPLR